MALDVWVEKKRIHTEHEALRTQARRYQEEINYYKAMRIKSNRQLQDCLWQIKHRELSLAVIYDRMSQLDQQLKTIKVLYETP